MAHRLTKNEQTLIVAGIRALQHYGKPPGYGEIPDTGATDGLAEDLNAAEGITLEGKEETKGIILYSLNMEDVSEINADRDEEDRVTVTPEDINFLRDKIGDGMGDTWSYAVSNALDALKREKEGK